MQDAGNIKSAEPGSVVARNSEVQVSNPGRVGCVSSRFCIQCSKLFKGLECAVLSMVLCTIKNPWSHSIRVEYSPDIGLPSIAISVVWKKQKMFLPHPRVKLSIVGSLRDQELACSASDHQGANFESCGWRTVSSHSSHHPQQVLLAQFRLYVHKGGLNPDSFHFYFYIAMIVQKAT